MNRQPLSAFNSIDRNHDKSYKSISEIETFLKEIDRLQTDNQKLKDRLKAAPSLTNTMDYQKLLSDNQELKNQLDYVQNQKDLQEKNHSDALRQLESNQKQELATLRYQIEQQEINHRQQLRQEQAQNKAEIAKLQQALSKISSAENNNQNLVQVMENELAQVKQANNILEEKLEQAMAQFELQSKDQEFTLMKQQTIITSQEQYLNELKQKLQVVKDQNFDMITQLKKYKEIADAKSNNEIALTARVKELEHDLKHATSAYYEHKQQLQQRVEELIQNNSRQVEQITLLQTQQCHDQELINRLSVNLENEQKNRETEIRELQEGKAKLIQYLQIELVQQKEQNHEYRSVNQRLEQQLKELQAYYLHQFRDLECKTNILEGECGRLNNIIIRKDQEMADMSNLGNSNEKVQETIELKDQEINILKQQNESLINDLSRQADNYRHLALQHKQYQKFAEEVKLNNITINELQSKCELQDKEIERLRMKVLEKSQLLEKVQKDNLDYQAKLKSRLR